MDVAIKCYSRARLNTRSLQLVSEEIELHSSLSHPGLTSFYGWFEDKRRNICIVLELAKRGDLFGVIHYEDGRDSDGAGTLTESQVCQCVIRPIASALAHMHAKGIMHRDIKPGNVLVAGDGMSCKLADFEFAVNYRRHKVSTRLGTLEYMAPEMLRCDTDMRNWLRREGKSGYGPEVGLS
jgi:aurora kinase